MSGYNYSDPDEGNTGSGLRKQLEEALGEIRSLRAQIDGDKRQDTVSALLKEKGLDPAVAGLIPSDADPAKWLEEKGHLLGVKPKEEKPQMEGEQPNPVIQMAPDDDPALVAEREALAAIREAAESGSQSPVNASLLEEMDKINTEEELLKFFQRNGAGTD